MNSVPSITDNQLCTFCGKTTDHLAFFCQHCGSRLQKECPNCAELIKFKARICRFCGYEYNQDTLEKNFQVEQERIQELRINERVVEELNYLSSLQFNCPKCSNCKAMNHRDNANCRICSESLLSAKFIENPFQNFEATPELLSEIRDMIFERDRILSK